MQSLHIMMMMMHDAYIYIYRHIEAYSIKGVKGGRPTNSRTVGEGHDEKPCVSTHVSSF